MTYDTELFQILSSFLYEDVLDSRRKDENEADDDYEKDI